MTAAATKEDVRLIRTILAELTRQSKVDMSVFSYRINRETPELQSIDAETNKVVDTFRSSVCILEIRYRPRSNSNHAYKHIDKVDIEWCSQISKLELTMVFEENSGVPGSRSEYTDYYEEFRLDMTSDLRDDFFKIKKEYISLYKRIKHFCDVETVEQKRKDLENAVYGAFPALLDDIIMGDNFEKKD